MKNRIRLFLCVVLLLALGTTMGLSAGADYVYNLSTAETCYEMIVFQFYTNIIDANFSEAEGDFAPGLEYSHDDTFMYVSGTPSASGSYTISGKASTLDGGYENYSLTINVQQAAGVEIPVATPAPQAAPNLTKSPTDETVIEGASAMFIARADDANRIEWYLVEPGSYSSFTVREAVSYLDGLSYSGLGTEVLELYNIPLEMNNWQVECAFTNAGGTVVSDPATIYVEELKLVNPTIKTQPQGGEKDLDSAVILSVIADNNTKGSQLKYQWYMSSTGSGNLNPISGANSSSYTPPKTQGTVYYTVAVWSSIEGRDSGKTYSSPAAVTYGKAAASPAPSATASPAPTAAPSVSPKPSTEPVKQQDEGGFGIIGILIIAMLLSAALAAFILVILRKNAKQSAAQKPPVVIAKPTSPLKAEKKPLEPVQPKAAPPMRDWQCSCGALNNTAFCTQCGRAKPVAKPCANCGWTPESINQIPRFCPECGSPFGDKED